MNAACRHDGDLRPRDWARERSPGNRACGEAPQLWECDQRAEQATECLPAPAAAPAQDAFTKRVDWCACWSIVFVHHSSSSRNHLCERRGVSCTLFSRSLLFFERSLSKRFQKGDK